MDHTFTDKRASSAEQSSAGRETSTARRASSQQACSSGCEKNVGERERWLSLGGGALLALMGASRGGLSGMAVVGLASGLLYRGLTGHCYGYDMMGVSTADTSDSKERTSSSARSSDLELTMG